jgi:hypothetical protein
MQTKGRTDRQFPKGEKCRYIGFCSKFYTIHNFYCLPTNYKQETGDVWKLKSCRFIFSNKITLKVDFFEDLSPYTEFRNLSQLLILSQIKITFIKDATLVKWRSCQPFYKLIYPSKRYGRYYADTKGVAWRIPWHLELVIICETVLKCEGHETNVCLCVCVCWRVCTMYLYILSGEVPLVSAFRKQTSLLFLQFSTLWGMPQPVSHISVQGFEIFLTGASKTFIETGHTVIMGWFTCRTWKITISGTPNHLKYCVICIVYT